MEAVQGFLDVAQKDLNIADPTALAHIWTHLSTQIHPLVLGQIYRTRQQIRSLAAKLLSNQDASADKTKKIVSFLCSESGSHDHTINRREARELGLVVENPDDALYAILKAFNANVVATLELRTPFSPDTVLAGLPQANYSARRALIESTAFGSHQFVSEGALSQVQMPGPNGVPQIAIRDDRKFEGWRKEA